MRRMRAVVNAALMVTLVKPVVRRMVARWRKRAQESPATTIGIPLQELLEAALIEELTAPAADPQPRPAGSAEPVADRDLLRMVFIAFAVAATAATTAFVVAALIRRRRSTGQARGQGSAWVAVPVDAPAEEAEGTVAQASLAD